MKKIIFLLITSSFFISCNQISGNGNVITENRNISKINEIRNSGSINVEIRNGSDYLVSVEDDENLLPYVITEVNGNTLNIRYKNGVSINNDHASVIVTVPSLERITTSGSGDISGNDIIKSDEEFEIHSTGSGDVDIHLDAPSIKVSGSGSGNIQLSGRTRDFDARMSGSGDLMCANLQSENTSVSISGSGNASVFASVSLKARTTGSGDINYSGNPKKEDIHKSGSGDINEGN
jgi:hypothetical protein